MSPIKTFRVHGYCLVPCLAQTEIVAASEAEARKKAQAAFAKNKMKFIDQNGCDFDSAFDWQPSVEPIPSAE